jgi:malonyl-CoA O-methyltransferase
MTAKTPSARRELDAAAVERALRRVAHTDHAPWLHGEVARRMAERLGVIRLQPGTLIDWWGFSGAGGDMLDAAYPDARRVVIEPSEALQARSRAAAQRPWWSARRWHGPRVEVASVGGLVPGDAQLVWANMMLHAVPDPPALFQQWFELLTIDGFVMFSCLGPGTLAELRALYARLGWGVPAAAFVDMHDLGDMLVHAGFSDPVLDQETLTLHWADPSALLAELRTLGSNAAPDRHAGLRTPRWHSRLIDELAALAGPDGRLRLSFEVAYGHAFKSAPRARAGEPTSISLQDMRTLVRTPRSSAR